MNLHKDKERLRHQRQVKLLDEVMKIVPKPLNGSASKVRNLRRLVLYYHFMQKVHAQISNGNSSILKGRKKSKKIPRKSAHKPAMLTCETKRKIPRANIVFLKVDKSKTKEGVIINEPIVKGNCFESAADNCMKNLEYEVPEVAMANDTDNSNAAFDHNQHLSVENAIHSNNINSPGEFSVQPDLISEDNSTEKVNRSVAKTDFLNSCEWIREKLKESVTRNISNKENINLGKYKKRDFQNVLQDYSNNSSLREITVPNTINENVCNSDINYLEQDLGYILEACPIENISNSPINLPSRDVIFVNNNCKPLYNYGTAVFNSHLNKVPSVSDNLSDNCSSSTLTDNLHIDVENFSESSNEVCKIKAGDTNDMSGDGFESPKAFVYEYPQNALMNCGDYVLPYVSSSHSYLENYNEIPSGPVNYLPQFDTILSKNDNFIECPPVIQYFEPMHSFQDRFVEPQFVNDDVAFYSPSFFENLSSEKLPLSNSRGEIKTESDFQETSFIESKPILFEEVSYPLSQYINSYRKVHSNNLPLANI